MVERRSDQTLIATAAEDLQRTSRATGSDISETLEAWRAATV